MGKWTTIAEAAIELLAKKGGGALDSVPPKALPTDEASRMARAREMGFGPVMYHGSKQDIDEFVPGYDDGLTFLADDPQFANDWIGKGRLQQRIGSEEELKSMEQRYDALRRETIDWEGLNKMPPGDEFSAAYDKAVSESRGRITRKSKTSCGRKSAAMWLMPVSTRREIGSSMRTRRWSMS
jgi:hypothetical protein